LSPTAPISPPPRKQRSARCFRLVAPNAPDTPQLARDHVAYLLLRERLPELADTARLLISELVTNVYQHTTTRLLTVETTFRPGRVRFDVYDGLTTGVTAIRPPVATLPGIAGEGGRGLMLVDQLAARWGVTIHGGTKPFGKSVWFILTYAAEGR
jgi:anti-sigma regulatory factor (Ser/Thr protein kinase)